MAKHVTNEDLELLGELGVDIAPKDTGKRTPREQRIIAGFEEIERFYEVHGRLPQHGEDRDIFERLYAVRLERLKSSEECLAVLNELDSHGLLQAATDDTTMEQMDDAALLASLGVEAASGNDVTTMTHVRGHHDRKAAEDVAQRRPCHDFEQFRLVFEQVQKELDAGTRSTSPFEHNGKLEPGDMFILGGQKVLVAHAAEVIEKEYGRKDRRLRAIFDNGTESNLWLRSLQRALYKDNRNRRILPSDDVAPPLFAGEVGDADIVSGSIYVLRSKSDNPFVAEHRELIHKIGVTGGDVKTRIANAKKDPTYLLAEVEIVAEYKLANINRKALEVLLLKVFAVARLDVHFKDRFGARVEPKEWFLVPLSAIDEAVERIRDQSIGQYHYDPNKAKLVKT